MSIYTSWGYVPWDQAVCSPFCWARISYHVCTLGCLHWRKKKKGEWIQVQQKQRGEVNHRHDTVLAGRICRLRQLCSTVHFFVLVLGAQRRGQSLALGQVGFHSPGSLTIQGNRLRRILSSSTLTCFQFLLQENRTCDGTVHALATCLRRRQDTSEIKPAEINSSTVQVQPFFPPQSRKYLC